MTAWPHIFLLQDATRREAPLRDTFATLRLTFAQIEGAHREPATASSVGTHLGGRRTAFDTTRPTSARRRPYGCRS